MSAKQRGSAWETEVCRYLRERGWEAWRVLPSTNDKEQGADRGRGAFDVIATRSSEHSFEIRLIEAKATKTPFSTFSPGQRQALLTAARRVHGEFGMPGLRVVPLLAWKKKGQREPVLIPSSDWPGS